MEKHPIKPGDRFGRLLVVSESDRVGGYRKWLCRCDCGTVKSIYHHCLYTGHSQSCGCLGKERRQASTTIHGHNRSKFRSPEYHSWWAACQRCSNPNNVAYATYGGRGIRMCGRWRGSNGFMQFLSDMGPRPSKSHSIDRIDVNGDYCPENCRWATMIEQRQNTTKTHWLEIGGERLCLTEAARRHGLSVDSLRKRLKSGWALERAIETPMRAKS